MSILSFLDRKFWSTLLNIDGKFEDVKGDLEQIDEKIDKTNTSLNKLGEKVEENKERIIKLESNFEDDNFKSKVKDIFNTQWKNKLQEYGSIKQITKGNK